MNLDPTWTQAWSSVIALVIAVGVPIYQENNSQKRAAKQEMDRIKDREELEINRQNKKKLDEKLENEKINLLKRNINNFINHSDYTYSQNFSDDIALFPTLEDFEKWLIIGLRETSDPKQQRILLFGQDCFQMVSFLTAEEYEPQIDALKRQLNDL